MAELNQPTLEASVTVESRSHGVIADVLKTLLLALIIFLTARLLLLPYQVDGRSMSPSLADQERVLVNRAVYMHFSLEQVLGWIPGIEFDSSDYYPFHSPDRGDVLVLNPPTVSDEPFIKRTIGIAGDEITIRDGRVYLNGVVIYEPYLTNLTTTCDSDLYCDGFVVPVGMVYVMGDNREHSMDSRVFGPVPLDNVIGQAWFSNWPADRFGPIPDLQPEMP